MVNVVMPKMGESITEGTILEWKKNIGESISKDEPLLEIATDKVDSEVPSPASGILIEINAKVNDTVPVGHIIARIAKDGEADTSPKKEFLEGDSNKNESKKVEYESPSIENMNLEKHEGEIEKQSNISSSKAPFKRFYSPLVKSIAKKEGIPLSDLDSIAGSGKNNRLNKQDILSYIQNRNKSIPPINEEDSSIKQPFVHMENRLEPMSRMRKKIAEHMVESVRISPHVYTTVEADVTNLVSIRSDFSDSFKNRSGVSLTYTPMIIDACIRSIQEFPLLNASIDGDNIVHHQNINMGVAVALPDNNLIVPVINSSEEKNFLGLARSTADLAVRARKNALQPEEIFGSTFTVTNPGVFGGLFGMGIINQPNVGILAVGTFQKRPVVKQTEYGDTIVIRTMVYLTLSYDHRIIDGAYGTRFLSKLVENLEKYNSQGIEG